MFLCFLGTGAILVVSSSKIAYLIILACYDIIFLAHRRFLPWPSPSTCRTAPVFNLHNDQVHGWVLTNGSDVSLRHRKRADVHANPPSPSHTHLQPSSDTTAKDHQEKNCTASFYTSVHFSVQNAQWWDSEVCPTAQHWSNANLNFILVCFIYGIRLIYFIYSYDSCGVYF